MCDYCGSSPNYCSNCGRALTVYQAAPLARGEWRPMGQMQSVSPWLGQQQAPAPVPGGSYSAWRRSPARTPDIAADVLVPALQALATGLAVAGLSALLPAFYRDWSWYTPLVTFSLSSPIVWMVLLRSNRAHMWAEESYSQDPPEQPAPPVHKDEITLNVIHKDEDGFNQTFRFDLSEGITLAMFADFASGVTQEHRGLAQSDWTGAGKPFSKPVYKKLIEKLLEARIVQLKNSKSNTSGYELTGAGRRALLEFVYTTRKHAQARNGAGERAENEPEGEGR